MIKTTSIKLSMLFLISVLYSCNYADHKKGESMQEPEQSEYDSIKAIDYGADQYGMKKYVMAFLKRGPNRDLDSIQKQKLQKAHLENIGKMAEEGKLVLAGPFFGDGDIRGIYVFNVANIEEAEKLTNTDPAIQAGSLEMELIEWYGSAALMAVNEIHHTLSKKNITEN